ncbi:hypothetical protein [Robiginitalea biformata]|uniref:Uncharacterized protein n=1 Tax=Robiginitalea biformata (strain ATCC BAA-864 / DSM 15991 / KCTC 12146 / HTCC2501) TaxID=313596 RepID=A4CPX1_ROBBH|nr:hypothetical protein [Robiginitalea biformata]EAR14056.1 hypothetical protein RB2501_01480 [Robiginitalea biformata HTCC2501]
MMIFISRVLTKIKSTRPGITAATVSGAAAIAIIARVGYILYNGDRDIEGDFMGFRWLSSFLYSFGIEIAFITVGMVINYSTNFMTKDAVNPFRFFGWAIQGVGFFFMFWIFIDASIFGDNVEIAFSICFAIVAVFVQTKLRKFFTNHISSLKRIIRRLNNTIILETPNHVKDVEVYYDEVMWPVLNEVADEL